MARLLLAAFLIAVVVVYVAVEVEQLVEILKAGTLDTIYLAGFIFRILISIVIFFLFSSMSIRSNSKKLSNATLESASVKVERTPQNERSFQQSSSNEDVTELPGIRGGFRFNYVYVIPISIFGAKVIEILLRAFDIEFASFPTSSGAWFVSNFIGWFGVLYAILVTLVLIRVWEQFDQIDREFDLEADTVRSIYEDVLFLQDKYKTIGKDIVILLNRYVQHVLVNYPREIKTISDTRIVENNGSNENREASNERIKGDAILREIRRKLKLLFQPRVMNEKANEILVSELFQRLNELIDIRGDRIGLASQRLFDTVRFVVLVTSTIYVLPFYFVSLSPFPNGALDDILVGGVTLLVIFIYLTIEDFDEPFFGTWQISDEPWRRLLVEMASTVSEEELKNPKKSQQ